MQQLGETGHPVVDASARQLLQEDFMHNRGAYDLGELSDQTSARELSLAVRRILCGIWTDGDRAQNNLGWR